MNNESTSIHSRGNENGRKEHLRPHDAVEKWAIVLDGHVEGIASRACDEEVKDKMRQERAMIDTKAELWLTRSEGFH